jgi:DNA-binding IclR family transcriptional regulator
MVLGTVCRAGDLLELFDLQQPEWGATAVSRRLAITKSQAHEMLVSLEAIGLLRRAGRGRFRLGWKMVTLSQRLMRIEFTNAEARIVRELGEHLKVSVDLVTCDGDRCVRIGGYGPSNHSNGGARVTGKVSGTGKVLLAAMPAERVEALLPGLGLDVELAAVRERQVAFEEDEDRRGVAAPVHDADGMVLAALGVTVDPLEWDARGPILTRAVTGAARRLSESLRGRHSESFVMPEPGLPAVPTAEKILA